MKLTKKVLIGLGIVIILAALGVFGLRTYTKSHSPEDTVVFKRDGLEMEVFYCRPYKKVRDIFGGLVPFDKVWRTGANEATTFECNKDLFIEGKKLPKGKYTLWTVPEKESWTFIFNSKLYGWGVTMEDGEVVASREPEFDVLSVRVPSENLDGVVEQFTISFGQPLSMDLEWDQTMVRLPIKTID